MMGAVGVVIAAFEKMPVRFAGVPAAHLSERDAGLTDFAALGADVLAFFLL